MNFNEHSKLKDAHAFLSPSKHSWINYTPDKAMEVYKNQLAVIRGTKLHAFAHDAITLGIKMAKSKSSLNMFVNDAIGYRMNSEQVLYYSDNCFGTCDAISYRQNLLRIHDLKTGITPASFEQLEIYEALFCLEYKHKPNDFNAELRIYQFDEVIAEIPDPEKILYIMDKIIELDKSLNFMKGELIDG